MSSTKVLTMTNVEGSKLGRRTKSRLLLNSRLDEVTQLLNHAHGSNALKTKAG